MMSRYFAELVTSLETEQNCVSGEKKCFFLRTISNMPQNQ